MLSHAALKAAEGRADLAAYAAGRAMRRLVFVLNGGV